MSQQGDTFATLACTHKVLYFSVLYQLYKPRPAVLLLISSNVVQAPIQLTKYDSMTKVGENVLEMIWPSKPIGDEFSAIGIYRICSLREERDKRKKVVCADGR